jgi:hypothetical protein
MVGTGFHWSEDADGAGIIMNILKKHCLLINETLNWTEWGKGGAKPLKIDGVCFTDQDEGPKNGRSTTFREFYQST